MSAILEMARRASYNVRTKDFVWDLIERFEDQDILPAKQQAEFEMKCRYQEFQNKSRHGSIIPEYRVREI